MDGGDELIIALLSYIDVDDDSCRLLVDVRMMTMNYFEIERDLATITTMRVWTEKAINVDCRLTLRWWR